MDHKDRCLPGTPMSNLYTQDVRAMGQKLDGSEGSSFLYIFPTLRYILFLEASVEDQRKDGALWVNLL